MAGGHHAPLLMGMPQAHAFHAACPILYGLIPEGSSEALLLVGQGISGLTEALLQPGPELIHPVLKKLAQVPAPLPA